MNANTSRAPGSAHPDAGSTASAASPTSAASTGSALGAAEVSFARALRAEWLKLTSLRLNWWLSLAALAVMVLTLTATVFSTRYLLADTSLQDTEAQLTGLGLFENAFASFTLITLLMGALAAVAITTEHSSGSIRSSLAAVPNRSIFFAAKLLAVCGFIAALTAALMLLCFLVLLPLAGFYDVMPPLWEPELWWMTLSSAAVVIITAALGFGLGALLRSTAGAVVTYCLLLFSGPIALGLLQALTDFAPWVEELARFEIFALQRQFTAGSASLATDLPVPLAGALLLAWAGLVLIPGWLLFTRRDA
ncbi:ABC transporter permease [Nesterenkonia sp. E16_7]|uniref:ABC transporter permease n=1 Tax=unclassified Nesterenkonia TaxID=2629769 RepID=UPI001A9379CB|nr:MULTISPECIES: ABC transporter permease [unclassified Nesterenkonia]MBO0596623.1 ABC transporter permease [Nesterenkonia sp. E16_10]MBO0597985.1 ABC transporter permease [Nesterenkonia sp. E16_7]